MSLACRPWPLSTSFTYRIVCVAICCREAIQKAQEARVNVVKMDCFSNLLFSLGTPHWNSSFRPTLADISISRQHSSARCMENCMEGRIIGLPCNGVFPCTPFSPFHRSPLCPSCVRNCHVTTGARAKPPIYQVPCFALHQSYRICLC